MEELMAQSFAGGLGRARTLAVLIGLLGALLATGDRAAADEGGIEDNPPVIVNGEVSPSSLSHEGGSVQIRAEIVDDRGLYMTYAQIYRPDASSETIQLFEGYKDNYFATLEVPPNYSDSAVEYGVEVQVYDVNGAYSASLIGGVQVEAAPQFDEPPYIGSTTLTPQFLPATGGAVTIGADAGDNRSLSGLFALIVAPDGSSTTVPMNPVSSSHFEGTYEAPPNSGPLAAEYLVEVVAEDDAAQQSRASAGTITVAVPPPPPSAGVLEISPAGRSFGTVKLGKSAQRQVFVRNLPRKGGEPVEATVVIAGSGAFSLAGESSAVHFVLQPGEKRAFAVEFRPVVSGGQFASVEIVRDDGAQPGLSVALSGTGSG
ncbi:MAG TPA: hypothetical protein VFN92_02365 [Solirubrobacterales bacterium]|nr:hypothetical protein [Solirubrobacterales bacterium]